MPNIVRVIKAGVPPYDNVFEVHWMEDNGDTRWVHIFAKDELNAWQKAEKQLSDKAKMESLMWMGDNLMGDNLISEEKENGRSLTDVE